MGVFLPLPRERERVGGANTLLTAEVEMHIFPWPMGCAEFGRKTPVQSREQANACSNHLTDL